MSEDRLEKALEALKRENADPEKLANAHARVLEKLGNRGAMVCTEFRPQFQDYLEERLSGNRLILMEDHLSRCPQCRAQLAVLKGERKVPAMPLRRTFRLPRWAAWAAAASVVLLLLYLGRDRIDTLLAPGGPRATVVSVARGLYRVPEGALESGAGIGEGDIIRTGHRGHARLRLADGSMLELNEGTELSLHRTWSGQSVHLQHGDIIIRAAQQRLGHLRVQTRDSLASVKGTIFAVSAGISGTVVSVIEGSVAVLQPGSEVVLGPGEQAVSNPVLASSVAEAISWSSDAETYLSILASLAHIQKQIAGLPSPVLRTQSGLLQFVPSNMIVYAAVPNLGGTLGQAMMLAEQQAAENPAFGRWWNSGAGQDLKRLIDRIQSVAPHLGDEIVYGYAVSKLGPPETVPVILAAIQPGKRIELEAALANLNIPASQTCYLTDSLMTVSDSQTHLQWLLGNLGNGAATSFTAEIAAHYRNGASWLLAIDLETILSFYGNQSAFFTARQMKHLFIEQHGVLGDEENEMTVTFKGPRTGLASFLASTGSGGAAEYLSSEAVAAAYISTREPRQMFEELIEQLVLLDPSFRNNLSQMEAILGVSFRDDLASALGTESAIALESLSTSGPVWTIAALVHDSMAIDNALRRFVEVCNNELAKTGQNREIHLVQEVVNGRTWTTLKSTQTPLAITYTYDRGYLVAASDRAAALRAIATRDGGFPLVRTPAFQQKLPSSAGLHPAGFFWLNTKGAFQSYAALISNPAVKKLMAERDPILVVFGGGTEQIHAASRTRLSGLLMDIMLLQGLSRTRARP